jgi:SAM-dependent methyltransferase
VVEDPRGTGAWPKRLPDLSLEQQRVREKFVARWLEVLPKRYGLIERFNHHYPLSSTNGGRTLEIGAGLGEHLRYEHPAPGSYYALDLREELVEQIRSQYPNVQALTGDCQQRLPFEDGFFNRVVAIHVLEHLPNLPRALDEIARVLAPSGHFVAVIPCEGGLAYSLARRVSAQRLFEREYGMSYEWFIRSEHVNVPWEIVSELRKRFRIERTRYFPFLVPSVEANLVMGLTSRPLPQSARRNASVSTKEVGEPIS